MSRHLLSILFLKTKRNDLARPVMGTIFLVNIDITRNLILIYLLCMIKVGLSGVLEVCGECLNTSLKSMGTRDELSITLYLQSEINFCSVRMPVNA